MLSAVPDLPSLKGSTTMGTTMLVWAIMAAATSALRSSATTCARRPCAPLKAPLCWRAALRALSRCHPSRCARCRACRRPRSAKCAPNARHPSQAPLLRCQAPPLSVYHPSQTLQVLSHGRPRPPSHAHPACATTHRCLPDQIHHARHGPHQCPSHRPRHPRR